MMADLLFLIPLLPLLCGAVNALFGMRLPRRLAEFLAVAGVVAAAGLTLWLWPLCAGEGTRTTLFTWLQSGKLHIPFDILFDRLSAPMALMVTAVSSLIHLYAVGYMEEDRDYARFFSLLNLFVFSMLTITLAGNLLLLFLGWEGVGFCSYALIGFWYREDENAEAGRKAFLVTRAADVFLGIAILWMFSLFGTLSIDTINARAASLPQGTLTFLTLLLLAGACGKSAQIPFMTWLPDAMAGPTPVSALIHAATMVTAGVYLLCRLFPLVSLSPAGMAAIAGVGAVTALYAATCALGQNGDQASARLLHHEPGRLHVPGRGRRDGFRGHVPPLRPRLLQGSALHGRRLHYPPPGGRDMTSSAWEGWPEGRRRSSGPSWPGPSAWRGRH